MKNLTKIFFFFSFLFVYSCLQTVPNLSYVKKEVVSYYESGGYNKEVEEALRFSYPAQLQSLKELESKWRIYLAEENK